MTEVQDPFEVGVGLSDVPRFSLRSRSGADLHSLAAAFQYSALILFRVFVHRRPCACLVETKHDCIVYACTNTLYETVKLKMQPKLYVCVIMTIKHTG